MKYNKLLLRKKKNKNKNKKAVTLLQNLFPLLLSEILFIHSGNDTWNDFRVSHGG